VQFPDFARCKERSLLMADSLLKQNVDCKVAFGLYRPPTAKITWDERWQLVSEAAPEFSHFWLELTNMFWDCSLLQFGETGFKWFKKTEPRYTHLGYINLKGEIIKEFGPYKIQWESYEEGSIPTMKLVLV